MAYDNGVYDRQKRYINNNLASGAKTRAFGRVARGCTGHRYRFVKAECGFKNDVDFIDYLLSLWAVKDAPKLDIDQEKDDLELA